MKPGNRAAQGTLLVDWAVQAGAACGGCHPRPVLGAPSGPAQSRGGWGRGWGEVNSTEFVGKGLQGCREGGVSSGASGRPQAGAPARRPQVHVSGLGTQTCASD